MALRVSYGRSGLLDALLACRGSIAGEGATPDYSRMRAIERRALQSEAIFGGVQFVQYVPIV